MHKNRKITGRIKRLWFFLRYRIPSDIRHGEGVFAEPYTRIARICNPAKPWFWRRNKPPAVELADEYIKVVATAYWTGEGWELSWSALHKDGSTDWLGDLFNERDDEFIIFDWPFFLSRGSSKNLSRIGFVIV